MTNLQIIEFSKLELLFLEAVRNDDQTEQLRYMELIFFWMKKQFDIVRALMALSFNPESEFMLTRDLTVDQKAEFAFLQIEMISAAGKGNVELMADVEVMMREWFDKQVEKAANKEFKPKMKIIKN